jgi:hypothetical protein
MTSSTARNKCNRQTGPKGPVCLCFGGQAAVFHSLRESLRLIFGNHYKTLLNFGIENKSLMMYNSRSRKEAVVKTELPVAILTVTV